MHPLTTLLKRVAPCWRGLALALLGFAACAPASAQMSEGAEVYRRNCTVCHGPNGDGQGLSRIALVLPPRDFTTEAARRALTREYMIVIVRDGRPGTPMHGRKTRLRQPQIESVVDFIRAAFMRPEPGTPLARGREIYLASCAACHGERGQGGQTVGGKPLPPLSAATRASGLTRNRLLTAIGRPGHGAPAGSAASLPQADIEAVAGYVAGAFIDPYRSARRGDKAD